MNMFIDSDEHILCWGQTLPELKDAFHAGDEQFSTEDECVKNTSSSFSHTHTQLATRNFQTKKNGWIVVERNTWRQKQMHILLVTNALALETNSFQTFDQTSPAHTHS